MRVRVASLAHHQVPVHAARVVAGHVAEELVPTRLEPDADVAQCTRLAGLERAELDVLERVFVDGRAVAPEWQPATVRADGNQLVRLGSGVGYGEVHGA